MHVPGRPRDPAGVKALAIAARKSFEHYRPGGMRVHAGSVILEPGLVDADFAELASRGVWLAKAGFGAFATPYDYAPYVAMAKRHGLITMVHTGGSSIPGSTGIWAFACWSVQPDVSAAAPASRNSGRTFVARNRQPWRRCAPRAAKIRIS